MTARFPSGDYDGFMPPKGTIGMAFAAYKLWRRLPPAQKRAMCFAASLLWKSRVNDEFAQAILDWYEANQHYEAARKRRND